MSEHVDLDAMLPRPMAGDREGWKAYWKARNQTWRTEPEIDGERQRFLTLRRTILPDIADSVFPFKDIKLDRADVEWLLATHLDGQWPSLWGRVMPGLPKRGLDLRGADLRGADLRRLPLMQLQAGLAEQDWTRSSDAQREASSVKLQGANLYLANLQDASLRGAHLEGANLEHTHVEGTVFRATWVGGTLREEGGRRIQDYPPANLRFAYMDFETNMRDIHMGTPEAGYVLLADIHWDGIDLGSVPWDSVKFLGDEWQARRKSKKLTSATRQETLQEFETAVRANRQLAMVLRRQGLNEHADKFSYRAQILQRIVLRRQHRFLRYFGSGFLDLISGYGYNPLRSFVTYLLVVGVFALVYFLLGSNVHPPLNPLGAVVFSITSFHGRGFAAGESVAITNPVTVLAAVEAIIGLLIEITFIATFTQRFFAR